MMHSTLDFDFILQQLRGRNLTIASAESVTVGRVQTLLASPSGASSYFAGGITTYNLDQKSNLLKVDRDHAASCDCVSQQVAHEMAQGCLKLFGTDLSIATTGYAEPYPEEQIEEPFAFIAIASATGHSHYQRVSGPTEATSRAATQDHFAIAAIHLLIEFLESDEDKFGPLE